MKFGGTSVADASAFENVAGIVGERIESRPVVVVSALSGMTDALIRSYELAQAGETASGRRGADGMAGLAVDVGYADQAHLSRECVRLTGVTPTQLLGGDVDRCRCGHDHAASYRPFLESRHRVPRIA